MTVKATWTGDKATDKAKSGAVKGMALWGELVLAAAREVVPHDKGILSRSGRVSPVNESDLSVTVSFDTPYAVRQHEDLTLRHDQGRQAKYLEIPMTTEREKGLQVVARSIKGEL